MVGKSVNSLANNTPDAKQNLGREGGGAVARREKLNLKKLVCLSFILVTKNVYWLLHRSIASPTVRILESGNREVDRSVSRSVGHVALSLGAFVCLFFIRSILLSLVQLIVQ